MPEDALSPFPAVLSAWFQRSFGQPTDVQTRAWGAIGTGIDTLVAAPTGSGKTLAALLPGLAAIAREKASPGAYAPGVRLLYVTPLKALNNDIHHHVVRFAAELDRVAAGMPATAADWQPITAAVRTGDTPQSTRASMLKRPPDVLVTTPESLYLLLLAERSREMLRTVRHVVVDEIHDLVPSRRGAHLSLSLERLTGVVAGAGGAAPQRIGVSATQKPLETAALFLAGVDDSGSPRPCVIVESAMDKAYDVQVTMPDDPAQTQDREAVWQALTDRMMQLMGAARTALVFVNNRRLAERLVLRLNERFGESFARSHHGSVSRERRLEAERLLKEGGLRCLVATSSLELGIDVGHIGVVLQIDSPLTAASGIQRIGRAGHGVGDTSVGRIVARGRGALPEIAVLSRLIRARDIEPIAMPPAPLDVLAQQATAAVSAGADDAAALLAVFRCAAPYRELTQDRFFGVLEMLSGFYPFVRPVLDWNRETGTLAARSNTRMAAMAGAGTIPASANYPVLHAESRLQLGDLDEEFVHESRPGDVFQLGAHSWMIREIRSDRVIVSEAANRYSEVPFWRADAGGRSYALGAKIGAFLRELEERMGSEEADSEEHAETKPAAAAGTMADTAADRAAVVESARTAIDTAIVEWLRATSGFDARSAAELIGLARRQHAVSRLPTDERIVVERYEDENGRHHLVVHNLWGRRVNRAWLMALQPVWEAARSAPVYANAKDNGVEFVFAAWRDGLASLLWSLTPEEAARQVAAAVPASAMFAVTFRRMAETSLLLARGFTRLPSWQRRYRAEELLQASLPFAERFPLFGAAADECLREHLDVGSLKAALERVRGGAAEALYYETIAPSPLAAQFTLDYVSSMVYEGDAPHEELRRQLQQVSRELAERHFGAEDGGGAAGGAAVEPEVLAAEEARLATGGRAVAGPADLPALLKRRGDLSAGQLAKLAGPEGPAWAEEAAAAGAIAMATVGGERRYIARDERDVYARFPGDPAAASFVLLRYIGSVVAFTAAELAERFGLPSADAEARIAAWAEEGRIERPPFAERDSAYWASRAVVSRIVRLSLDSVRHAAAPVAPERWQRLLLERQGLGRHAAAAAAGPEALAVALAPLQGLFLPASLWESAILPSRLPGYRREDLDRLCASGELTWLGRRAEGEREGRIAFFLAGDEGDALREGALAFAFGRGAPAAEPAAGESAPAANDSRGSDAAADTDAAVKGDDSASAHPTLLEALRARGASFLTRLSADLGEPPSSLLPKLVELAWEGRAANDQFAPIRNYMLAGGKLHPKLGSGHGRWYAVDSPARSPQLDQDRAVRWTKQLLHAFGGVTGSLVNAYAPFGWDAALPMLKQLEEWGFAARGLFVEGVQALQFMERETISALRGWTPPRSAEPGGSETPEEPAAPLILSAADPAVAYGVAVPWPDVPGASFARKPGNHLVFRGDEWAYYIESNGKHIVRIPPRESADDSGASRGASSRDDSADLAALLQALKLLLRRGSLKRIRIDTWNGRKAVDADAAAPLIARGAERDRGSLVLWPSSLS